MDDPKPTIYVSHVMSNWEKDDDTGELIKGSYAVYGLIKTDAGDYNFNLRLTDVELAEFNDLMARVLLRVRRDLKENIL